jgi:2-iminobutanoate/2-iminopropanoate deaminase
MSGFRASRRARVAAAFALLPLLSCARAAVAAEAGPIDFYAVENAPKGMSLPFSEAVRAGDMLYLAGMLGTDASGKLAAGGIKAEAKQTMDNIAASLKKHGASIDRLVQCTVALADMADWPAFNEVYRGYFREHFPARMAYGANGLALGARVEVQCNAYVGSR